MSLKCQEPGCRGRINGMTGLQELTKLRQHYIRAHKRRIDMMEAMEIRERIERVQD